MTLYVPAKEFEGELWVKAADFQKAISEAEGRSIAQPEQEEPVCDRCYGIGYYDEGHENDDGTMSCGNYVECDQCKAEQQEPVAWLDEEKKVIYWHNTSEVDDYHGFKRTIPLYTHPPKREGQEPVYHLRQFGDVTKEQLDRYIATGDINPQPEAQSKREWQGLTDDAIWEVMAQVNWTYHPPTFARAIEAALKEKNT